MTLLQIFTGMSELVFCSFVVLLGALVCTSYVRYRRGSVDVLLLLFYWIFLSSFFVLIMGLVKILNPTIFVLVCIVTGAGILKIFRKRIVFILAELKIDFKYGWDWLKIRKIQSTFFFVIIFLLIARSVIHIFFWPPFIYDVINYHLPKVADWIQYQQIVMLETAVSRSFWPANFELLQSWFILFFQHDVIVEFAGIPFYLLAVISIFVVCRSLDIGRRISLFAALLYATTPSVVFFSTCGKNDISVSAIYLFILAIILDSRKYDAFFQHRLVIIFSALCLAVGTKPIIVFIVPGLLLIGGWSIVGHSCRNLWRNYDNEFGALFISWTMFSGLLLAGYWYIRNIIVHGNPFYPAGFSFLGKSLYKGEGFPQQGTFQWSSLVENLSNLVNTRIFDGALLHPDLPNMAGWGWFSFSLGLPCLLVAFVTIKEFRWLAAGFVFSLMLLFGWVTPDPWNMRFTLWFPALFSIAFVMVLKNFKETCFRIAMVFLGAICLALNMVATINYGNTPLNVWKNLATVPLFERSSAMLTTKYYEKLRRVLGENEPIGYYGNGNMRIYSLYGSDISHKIYYIDMSKISMADLNKKIKDLGIRILFIEAEPSFIAEFDANLIKNKFIKLEANNIYERQ